MNLKHIKIEPKLKFAFTSIFRWNCLLLVTDRLRPLRSGSWTSYSFSSSCPPTETPEKDTDFSENGLANRLSSMFPSAFPSDSPSSRLLSPCAWSRWDTDHGPFPSCPDWSDIWWWFHEELDAGQTPPGWSHRSGSCLEWAIRALRLPVECNIQWMYIFGLDIMQHEWVFFGSWFDGERTATSLPLDADAGRVESAWGDRDRVCSSSTLSSLPLDSSKFMLSHRPDERGSQSEGLV